MPTATERSIAGHRASISMYKKLRDRGAAQEAEYKRMHNYEKKQRAMYLSHAKKARSPDAKATLAALASQHRDRAGHHVTQMRSQRKESVNFFNNKIADAQAALKLLKAKKKAASARK